MELALRHTSTIPRFTTSDVQVALYENRPVVVPGRSVGDVYKALGRRAQRHASRAWHRMGFGPLAAIERVHEWFAEKRVREARLDELNKKVPVQLRQECQKLVDYCLPTYSYTTQLQGIVVLVTTYPGMRRVFVGLLGDGEDILRKLWSRDDVYGVAHDFVFHRDFAIACLCDIDICGIVEMVPLQPLWDTDGGGGLSAIEQLLVASECSSASLPSLCIRYITGIVELPSFWLPLLSSSPTPIFDVVLRKLLLRAVTAIGDLRLVDARAGPDANAAADAPSAMADIDGIDAFCYALLYKMKRPTVPEVLWFPALVELVSILQHPQAKHTLPDSSELAVGLMDDPIVFAAIGSRRERVEALIHTDAETVFHTTTQPAKTRRRRPLFDTLRSLAHSQAVIMPEIPSGRVDPQGREVRQVTPIQKAMTPIEDVFMLSIDAVLDLDLLRRIIATGHSRLPVFEEFEELNGSIVKKILGVLLVKQLVLLDPKDAVPLKAIPLNALFFVPNNVSLLELLDKFQDGHSHMAVVSRFKIETDSSATPAKRSLTQQRVRVSVVDGDEERQVWGEPGAVESPVTLDPAVAPLGIITLEDVLEDLIGEEICDEFDALRPQADIDATNPPAEQIPTAVEPPDVTAKAAVVSKLKALKLLRRRRSAAKLDQARVEPNLTARTGSDDATIPDVAVHSNALSPAGTTDERVFKFKRRKSKGAAA